MKLRSLFVASILVTLFTVNAHATTYWVNKSGNDANSCVTASGSSDPGAANSKLTTNAGIGCLSSGDTLMIGDGVYAEQWNKNIPGGSDASNPTIIQAVNNNGATVRCTTDYACIWLKSSENGGDYITFTGIDSDCVNGGADCAPYYTDQGGTAPSYITIQYGTMRNGKGEYGSGTEIVSSGGDGSNHVITHNTIYNNGDPIYPNHAHGIYGATSNSIYSFNIVYGNAGYGIQNQNGATSVTINSNVIYQNVNRGGCYVGSSTTTYIFNNVIYGNNTAVTGSSGGCDVDGAVAVYFYENTLYGNTGRCFWQVNGSNINYTNNICYGNGTDNIIVDAGTSTSTTNLLGTNPQFTNAGSSDFTLTASSPAIDAGTTLGSPYNVDILGVSRPQGTRYDQGAYERVQATPAGASYNIFVPSRLR